MLCLVLQSWHSVYNSNGCQCYQNSIIIPSLHSNEPKSVKSLSFKLFQDSSRSSARSSHVSSEPNPSNQSFHVPRPPAPPTDSRQNSSSESSQQEPLLLQGEYDERQAALEFQQAIAEWRSGGKKTGDNVTEKKVVIVSPERTPGE